MTVSNDVSGAGTVTLGLFAGSTDTGVSHQAISLTGASTYSVTLGTIPSSFVTSTNLVVQVVSVTGSVNPASVGLTSNVLTGCLAPPPPPPLGQPGGCTPGFWKNHLGAWNGTGFLPSHTVGSVFTNAFGPEAGETLLTALQTGGGSGLSGSEDNLLRPAVAALLNASSSGMNYPLTQTQVITQVNSALSSMNATTMNNLANQLNTDNNLQGSLCK